MTLLVITEGRMDWRGWGKPRNQLGGGTDKGFVQSGGGRAVREGKQKLLGSWCEPGEPGYRL